MIETALILPILVLMLCFAIDIGYFFIVAANLASASRNAVLYSAQGFTSVGQSQIPSAGTSGSLTDTAVVAGRAAGDLSGLGRMLTRTSVQVCLLDTRDRRNALTALIERLLRAVSLVLLNETVRVDAHVKFAVLCGAAKQPDVTAVKKVKGSDRQDTHAVASVAHCRMIAARSACIDACMIRGRDDFGACHL